MEIVKKVVLVGHFGVGKTSLVKRYVHESFSEAYLTTIGVKIDKKVVEINDQKVKLMLWDIAGESAAIKIPKKYLSGANGVIYVFDLTRKETYENIQRDLFEVNKCIKDNHCVVLANKSDLAAKEQIQEVRTTTGIEFLPTSAKTGDNVENAFVQLVSKMI